MSVTVAIETIGPEEAKKLIDTNVHNRHIRRVLVGQFKRDINAGRWTLNGETIKISESGNLLDGQHRLLAVIASGKSIQTLVVRGLHDSAQESIDTGAHRTFGDVLRLRGENHYYTLAAMTRQAWLLEVNGKVTTAGVGSPTFNDLTMYLSKHPGLRDLAPMAVLGPRSAVRIPGSLVGALAYHMKRLDSELGDEFWRQLFENDAKRGSAVWVLREQLIKGLTMAHRMSAPYRAALIIKAWNYWMEGREPAYIAWKPSEDFPRLRGPIREAVAV